MSNRGIQGGGEGRACGAAVRAVLLLSSLVLLNACSALTGPRNVPPPWELDAPSAASSDVSAPAPAPRAARSLDVSTPSPDRPAIYTEPGAGGESAAPAMATAAPDAAPSAAAPAVAPAPAPKPAPSRLQLASAARFKQSAAAASADYGSPTPVATVPTPVGPAGYLIGVGDTVVVTVFGQSEPDATVDVSDDGTVSLALLGKVRIAGLTPTQAAEHIAAELKRGEYFVDPKVSVTVQQFVSQQVSVLGEVKAPGRFPMPVRLTVLDAVALAGGILDTGSQRLYVLRPEHGVVTRYEIDLDALLDAGAGQEYFDVHAGDTLVVPRAEMFYVYGEVRLPNAYRLRPDMTVMQALSLGGGLTDKGSDRRVQVRRRGPDGRLVTESASLTDRVLPGDVIYVRERLF